MAPAPPQQVTLQAILLADTIYRDQGSGKYVLAGTFHQLHVPSLPATFPRTLGLFVSLLGVSGSAGIDIELVDDATGEVLLRTESLEVSNDMPDVPVELALEVPPLSLPHAGRYWFRVTVNGSAVGAAPVHVRTMEPANPV